MGELIFCPKFLDIFLCGRYGGNIFFTPECNRPPEKNPRGTPKYKYERISFINRWLSVWGMFQGYVGVFLDRMYFMLGIHQTYYSFTEINDQINL